MPENAGVALPPAPNVLVCAPKVKAGEVPFALVPEVLKPWPLDEALAVSVGCLAVAGVPKVKLEAGAAPVPPNKPPEGVAAALPPLPGLGVSHDKHLELSMGFLTRQESHFHSPGFENLDMSKPPVMGGDALEAPPPIATATLVVAASLIPPRPEALPLGWAPNVNLDPDDEELSERAPPPPTASVEPPDAPSAPPGLGTSQERHLFPPGGFLTRQDSHFHSPGFENLDMSNPFVTGTRAAGPLLDTLALPLAPATARGGTPVAGASDCAPVCAAPETQRPFLFPASLLRDTRASYCWRLPTENWNVSGLTCRSSSLLELTSKASDSSSRRERLRLAGIARAKLKGCARRMLLDREGSVPKENSPAASLSLFTVKAPAPVSIAVSSCCNRAVGCWGINSVRKIERQGIQEAP